MVYGPRRQPVSFQCRRAFRTISRCVALLWGLLGLTVFPAQAQFFYEQLRAFGNTNAMATQPYAPVIEASDGLLYGTTFAGGAAGNGTVFTIVKDGTGFRVLHSFGITAGDGLSPYAGLLEGSDGLLYGTTREGGNASLGAIFKMAKDGTGYSVLHSFSGGTGDGANPYAALIEGTDGMLYGVCYNGGASSVGTIFKLNPDGSGYAVVRIFPAVRTMGKILLPRCWRVATASCMAPPNTAAMNTPLTSARKSALAPCSRSTRMAAVTACSASFPPAVAMAAIRLLR